MKIHDMDIGEEFIFRNHRYKIMKRVPRHKDAWDCMDEEGRHVPFRGDVLVLEAQRRLFPNMSEDDIYAMLNVDNRSKGG